MKLECCAAASTIFIYDQHHRKDGPKMVNDDRDFPPLACLFLNEWPLLMPKRGRMRAGSALGWVTVLDCIVAQAHSLCYCTYCGIISLAGRKCSFSEYLLFVCRLVLLLVAFEHSCKTRTSAAATVVFLPHDSHGFQFSHTITTPEDLCELRCKWSS